jgi:hypothetical protein
MKRALPLAILLSTTPAFGFLDVGPLLQLVAGQITEIDRLTQTVGLAEENRKLLLDLNEGINKTVQQIQTLQAIIDRAQGLDPRQVKSLADLNDLLSRAKDTRQQIEELLGLKVAIANQAIAESALQSDTSYKMGQEMVSVGADLARESQRASPGRAAQISAAADSAQMLSQGVQLQTMSQMVQLQALSLEFQKSQVEKDLVGEKMRRELYQRQLTTSRKSRL